MGLDRIGALSRLAGIGNGTTGLHTPTFQMDQNQLEVGARYLAQLVKRLLEAKVPTSEPSLGEAEMRAIEDELTAKEL